MELYGKGSLRRSTTMGAAKNRVGDGMKQMGVTYSQMEEAMRFQGYNTLRYVLGSVIVWFAGCWAFGGEIKVNSSHLHTEKCCSSSVCWALHLLPFLSFWLSLYSDASG